MRRWRKSAAYSEAMQLSTISVGSYGWLRRKLKRLNCIIFRELITSRSSTLCHRALNKPMSTGITDESRLRRTLDGSSITGNEQPGRRPGSDIVCCSRVCHKVKTLSVIGGSGAVTFLLSPGHHCLLTTYIGSRRSRQ